MRDLSVIMSSVIIIILSSIFFVASAEERAERPVFTVGDYWVFMDQAKTIKREFVAMDGEDYIFLINGKKRTYDKDLNRSDTRYPDIKFPMFVGASWTFRTQGKADPNWGSYYLISTCRVEAFEEIETPAGKFKAFRITRETITEKSREPRGASTFWYSPKVGQVIKAREGDRILIKYMRKADVKG